MSRAVGPMRAGGTKVGTMEQCLRELEESNLPRSFMLSQVQSLVRFVKEVTGLVNQISSESGFKADSAAYLDILLAKDESELMRRVSATRCLKQDWEEKRQEWRKQKKSVINAIGSMTARTLRFEDKERKTIALHALEFYRNVMATDDGAIPGESESTDGLIEQYKRHRTEISKIPMYADSILKMLKDIRKTVRASSKLQPGPNAFAQFLEEWWASVVQFLQHSSIVEAEKNAREVMQTLKKLKGKQEENKKREISRLLSKLDDNAGIGPPMGRLSGLLEPAASPPPSDASATPEETSTRSSDRPGLRLPSTSKTAHEQGQQGLKRDRGSHSSEESGLSTLPAPIVVQDDGERPPGAEHRATKQHQQQQQRVSFADEQGRVELVSPRSSTATSASNTISRTAPSILRTNTSALVRGSDRSGGDSTTSPTSTSTITRPALTVCVEDGEIGGRHVNSARPPSSCGLRPPETSILTAGIGSAGIPSRVSWEEDSQGTAGTMDTAENMRLGVSFSGLPDSDDGEDDEDVFEAADNLDLGAVDLCAAGTGVDGQITYKDQEELRLPTKVAGPPLKKGVEQERFSAALDFFRQEQHSKNSRRSAFALRPPSPMRTAASFSTLPTAASLRSPRATANTRPFTPKFGGSGAVRVRTPASRSRGEGKEGKEGKAKAAARRRMSAERSGMTAKDKLLAAERSTPGRNKTLGRSLSVYIPSPRIQTSPNRRACKTPTVKSGRRALLSPGVRGFSHSAFFG